MYTFGFCKKNIKHITLSSFELTNDLYNITENNNTLEISEKSIKKTINIPIGCYDIKELLIKLESCISDKLKTSNIKLTHNKNKNRIYINGDSPFSFNFIENDNIFIPLRFMLGFDNKEYMNNNNYSSNNHPVLNIYDNIYIKITSPEYNKKFNTKMCQDFNFYERISFKQLDTFSQDIITQIENSILNLDIDIQDISLELYYRHVNHRKFYKINHRLKFLMVFNIEKELDL